MLSCLTPTLIKNPDKAGFERFIQVPCGQCAICRKRRAAQWTFRLLQEHRVSLPGCSYFLTLTYDNENVPFFNGQLSLYLPDWQNFWKRVRKRQSMGIKYYGVGEYGGTYGRPHYHAIVFNLAHKEYVEDSWCKGFVSFDPVNIATIGYVTGYVTKPPLNLEREKAGEIERTRPFMSKGLGKSYCTPAIQRYHNERLDQCYVTHPGGRKVAMPRYYKSKLYDEKALQRLRLSLKRMSKQKAKEAIAKFLHDHPGQDFEQHSFEFVRQSIQYDNFNQKLKRIKL